MVGRLPRRLRHALWALVVALVALSSFSSLPGALASSPNYVINGLVTQPLGYPVPDGVTVQLTSSATHAIYATTTGSGGGFQFTSSNTNGALTPGWWGLSVQPQGGVRSAACSGIFGKCAALPASSAPQYYYESAVNLTTPGLRTISNVTIAPYTTTLNATVQLASTGAPVSGANVSVISPRFPGVPLSAGTTNSTGVTTFPAPTGSWLLYTQAPGSPPNFNYTSVTIPSSGKFSVTIQVNKYLAYGSIFSQAGGLELAGFNQTLIDTTAGSYLYSAFSQFNPVGHAYAVGVYPAAGFSGTPPETFQLILSPVGYAPAFLTLSVPTSSGGLGGNPRNVVVAPMAPPAVYNTTLNYTSGVGGNAFRYLNVSTVAALKNYSVFPDLPNASVGQLWGQLALDFAHSLSLTNATFKAQVLPWVAAQGPFFPAAQDQAFINSTGFIQSTNYTNQTPNPGITGGYAASYGLANAQGLSMSWKQSYDANGTLPKGGTGGKYAIAFNYRHPTNGQSINYTIILPKGYVLQAGTTAPPNSKLVPAGAGGTWTKFYLDSKPSVKAYDTATFSVVKYGNVSARVDASVSTFTFSTKNVINSTRSNYQVVVGQGENVMFSAVNSTYPAGTNGSAFAWTFGEGSPSNTAQPTTHHIYNSTGKFVGSLNVTSSGGLYNNISFTVYVGNLPPTAVIDGNWTAAQNLSVSGAQYIIVNWSTSLQFNLSDSSSMLYAGAPVNGVLSVANWTLTSHNFTKILGNFSAGAGANASTPVSYSFQGAGNYLSAGTVSGHSVAFLGWQYNLTLTLWDGQGNSAKQSLVILVRDTQKPIAVVLAYNAAGNVIPSSGVVEGASGTAYVRLKANASSDPHNGSIISYVWSLKNPGNSSVNVSNSNVSWVRYLTPQTKPYTVNLTVTDRAMNVANTSYRLTVAFNTTTRPILSVTNETGPSSMTAGTAYTWWVNVTNTGGRLSTAENVQVVFSLTSQTATGPDGATAGTPASVKFYNVTKGVPGTTVLTPPIELVYNQSVRAQISWTPSVTGNKWLWVNATAANTYVSGQNLAHVAVSIAQNQQQLLLEYAAIGGGAIAVVVALVLLYRYRRKASAAPAKGGGRLERGSGSKADEEDEDDET
ncbi:MAG: hypothetical protein L3K14_03600 [Thermoplasmata archaeon]|nr:hypothetical protein [Thermoplasmata archaeon]